MKHISLTVSCYWEKSPNLSSSRVALFSPLTKFSFFSFKDVIFSCTFLISFLLGPKLGHVVSVVCNQGTLTEINSWQRNVFSCNAFENNFNISESLFVVSFSEQGLQWKLDWLSKTFTSLRKILGSKSWVIITQSLLNRWGLF